MPDTATVVYSEHLNAIVLSTVSPVVRTIGAAPKNSFDSNRKVEK